MSSGAGRASRSSLSAGTPDSLSDNEAASGLGARYKKPSVPRFVTNCSIDGIIVSVHILCNCLYKNMIFFVIRSTLTPGGSRPGSRTGSKPPSRHGSNLSLDSTGNYLFRLTIIRLAIKYVSLLL